MPADRLSGGDGHGVPATNDDYDVVVVGARVAGASTALLLARCGHRVLVVERGSEGTDTMSTHAVLRLGVLQLERWGVLDAIREAETPPIRRVTLGFGPDLVHIELSQEHGVDALYAPRRTLLDQTLVEEARRAGADVIHGWRMTDLVRDGSGRVNGVVIDRQGERSVIGSRHIVGADGVWSRTARLTRARAVHQHDPTNAVYYAYFQGVGTDGVDFRFTPGATAGLIPTNDGLVCVYVGWPSLRAGEFREDPETAFHLQLTRTAPALAAAVDQGSRVSRFRGTPGLPGFIRRAWGPGWALVGDAGFTKDPVSAHGISDALRDAELCARALDRSLRDPENEARAMSKYEQLRDGLSLPVFRISRELAAYRWDADRASTLMRALSEAVKLECDVMDGLPAWEGLRPMEAIARAG